MLQFSFSAHDFLYLYIHIIEVMAPSDKHGSKPVPFLLPDNGPTLTQCLY